MAKTVFHFIRELDTSLNIGSAWIETGRSRYLENPDTPNFANVRILTLRSFQVSQRMSRLLNQTKSELYLLYVIIWETEIKRILSIQTAKTVPLETRHAKTTKSEKIEARKRKFNRD